MDNLDFDFLTVLVLLLPALLSAIPLVLIGVGGVLAFRKGFPKSGGALVGAAVLSALTLGSNILIPRSWGLEVYSDIYLFIQAASLIASGLTAGGILGLVLSVPRTGRS